MKREQKIQKATKLYVTLFRMDVGESIHDLISSVLSEKRPQTLNGCKH